jgi:hypothetical protein
LCLASLTFRVTVINFSFPSLLLASNNITLFPIIDGVKSACPLQQGFTLFLPLFLLIGGTENQITSY